MQKHKSKLLRHVAFIMDGNRRWARDNKLKFTFGHRNGLEALKEILKKVLTYDHIEEVTLYVFSSDNWSRERIECDFLLSLVTEKLPELVTMALKEGVSLHFVGDLDDSRIPTKVKHAIARAHKATMHCTRLCLNLAFNYGADIDRLYAARKMAEDVLAGKLDPKKITRHIEREYLLSRDVSVIDLVIRTGGEVRSSNFFEWQTRYAEWMYDDSYWPDYTPEMFEAHLKKFERRERRYGGNSVHSLRFAD